MTSSSPPSNPVQPTPQIPTMTATEAVPATSKSNPSTNPFENMADIGAAMPIPTPQLTAAEAGESESNPWALDVAHATSAPTVTTHSTDPDTTVTPPPPRLDRSSEPTPAPSFTSSNFPQSNVSPPTVTTPATAHHEDEIVDPKIAPLKAMFPDFDAIILQSVLEAENGNQDRAIEALLAMNDPTYVPQTPQRSSPQAPNTDDDALLAQRLAAEEEAAAQDTWPPPGQRLDGQPIPYGAHNQNYGNPPSFTQEIRSAFGRRPGTGGTPQGSGGGTGGGGDFQEQVNKFAESGKRTFNTLFSKVKDKIKEFDRPAGSEGSYGQQQQQQQQQQHYTSQYPEYHGQGRHATQQYYAPTPQPTQVTRPPPASVVAEPQAQVPPQPTPSAAPPPVTPPTMASPGIDSTVGGYPTPDNLTPAGPPSANASPRPSIDRARLGLLPKRPVSLHEVAQSEQATARPVQHPVDRDDTLEYVENPFEGNH